MTLQDWILILITIFVIPLLYKGVCALVDIAEVHLRILKTLNEIRDHLPNPANHEINEKP